MANSISVVGLNHVKTAFPLLGVGVLILPATLRITFAYIHTPTLAQLFKKPRWLQALLSWWKPPVVTQPEVRTDRIFKNKSLYLNSSKKQRFVVSDILLVLECLLSGLAIDKYLEANADGTISDIQRGNENISRALDAFLVSSTPFASTENPFSVLERAGATTTPLMDLLAQELSTSSSRINTDGSSANSITDLISRLPAREQSRIACRGQLRAQAYRSYAAAEAERVKAFCAEPRTLASVNSELQALLEARIQIYQEAVLSAASEASDLWQLLAASRGRKEAWRSLGIDVVRLVTQKTKTTLAYLQDWVTVRLRADLLDTSTSSFQTQLDTLVAIRSKWIEQLQRDDAELVGKINSTFESFTSPLDAINEAQSQHAKERDTVESELSKHRDDVLTLPKNSLNSLDVLLAVSEQGLSKDFICDPKHFVNSIHKFLAKGEIAFESFQQASTVRSMISQQAALEVSKAASLSWIQVIEGRVLCRKEIVTMATEDLFKKLKSDHPYDDKIVSESRKIADRVQERAFKVLEYQQAAADCPSDDLRKLLAELHRSTTELIARRDSAIQAWHKQSQTLEHGMAWT